MSTTQHEVVQAARRLVEIQRASESTHISPAIKQQAEKELMEAVDKILEEERDE